jgi:hypothetical protein
LPDSNHHHHNIFQQSSPVFYFTSNTISRIFYDIHSNFNSSQQQTNTFKMQFTTILASTILAFATGISAAPTSVPNVTLRIANDQTGTSSDATVPADNVARDITALFQNTAIGQAGFIGTSAQLTQFTDTTKCQLVNKNYPSWVIQLDGRSKNFVDLDGDNTKPIPISISAFTFSCSPA